MKIELDITDRTNFFAEGGQAEAKVTLTLHSGTTLVGILRFHGMPAQRLEQGDRLVGDLTYAEVEVA